jgi:hypothetical protein
MHRAIRAVYVERSEDRLYYRKQRNRVVLFRTRFTTIWRIEIHINLKVYVDALKGRQR